MSQQSEKQPPDDQSVHKRFSAHCFNQTWALIDRPDRTPLDDEKMLRLAMTSHWHWTQRGDYAPQNASVAYWLISRVFALLHQPENARWFAGRSLDVIGDKDVPPFYEGYAHEALARAEAEAGNTAGMRAHLAQARNLAESIADEESKTLLLSDLDTIGA